MTEANVGAGKPSLPTAVFGSDGGSCWFHFGILGGGGVSESYSTIVGSNLSRLNIKEFQSPGEPPDLDQQRVLRLLAPSPLMPFTNVGVPKLSGNCPLNFSKAESIITTTAIDCWGPLAPYLANVVCCSQLDATINILIAQSSLSSGTLTINETHATYCLSDITQLLEAQGSYNRLLEICSINPTNLTLASCPLLDLRDIESTLNNSRVIESCKIIDPVKECGNKVCENAIMDTAVNMASKNYGVPDVIDDCKKIVVRWLASKLEPLSASKVLRGISSCKINKVCPLVFPDMSNVSKECGKEINNQTSCCDALEHYFTQLQDQSFITNLQAISCASSLAASLQKANVTLNVYNICRVKLKDFSLQVGSQDSGCLFPSLPFDVTYDQSSGIDFKCDLNDNVAAPWPRTSSNPNLPALPKATSDQKGLQDNLFISTLLMLAVFI
ncbi:putative GPI-anchored protein At1g61900 [Bidens hawaiensis]|uniref:putative GPI-anchored protein At1g61900 n=1 Tax=Bidens hawaiensis TaxID=980011 RepID=UPI004049BEF6